MSHSFDERFLGFNALTRRNNVIETIKQKRGWNSVTSSLLARLFLQFPLHRLHPPSSWGQAPPIWSSSSTLTPLWGMDQSLDGKYSTEPASPHGWRLMVWAHLPIRYGIWSRTQSTTSVSCSPGLGRAALEHLGPLWSAGQNVQVSQMHAWFF